MREAGKTNRRAHSVGRLVAVERERQDNAPESSREIRLMLPFDIFHTERQALLKPQAGAI